MSLLWAVPPVAMAAAVAIVLLQLREMADATSGLTQQLARLDEVRAAVVAVRHESAEARATLRGLRSR